MMKKAGVLIVEDSFIVSFHLQKILEGEGYSVTGIEASGESALARVKESQPDIVLMDIMLEGQLDGIETARILRGTYGLPVIFITALSDKATIQRAKITEPFGFLTKPFQEREIFTTMEMALYKHKIESQLRASEAKYFSTVRSINDALILIDNNASILYMNPKAERMTGWNFKDAFEKLLEDILIVKEELEDVNINPLQCLLSPSNGAAFMDDKILVSRSGVRYPVGEASLSALTDPSGKCLGVVMIFKDLSEKAAHQRLLKEFEMKRLAAILEGQEAERSRVAKDLHDGLGQILTAIKMNLTMNASPDVSKLGELIEEAIQESVRISENLLPAKLKDFDLATCLKTLCLQVSNVSNVCVNFEYLGENHDLTHVKKVNLYRIAQEAISNAIKHSGAGTITVQLNEDEEKIQLTIEDDGHGFTHTHELDNSKHHGLVNMRERTEIMGGKLTIESDHERGTLIFVETPIEH